MFDHFYQIANHYYSGSFGGELRRTEELRA
jgi:hypothetical protein